MDDYQGFVKGLEKEYGINLTAGEFTASPKVIAKEDALANKPDIETFDTFTKNRRSKIVRRIEKLSMTFPQMRQIKQNWEKQLAKKLIRFTKKLML